MPTEPGLKSAEKALADLAKTDLAALLDELALTREHIASVLENAGRRDHCKGCGAPIYWIKHANGKNAPYTISGANHFIDCPKAGDFRRKR